MDARTLIRHQGRSIFTHKVSLKREFQPIMRTLHPTKTASEIVIIKFLRRDTNTSCMLRKMTVENGFSVGNIAQFKQTAIRHQHRQHLLEQGRIEARASLLDRISRVCSWRAVSAFICNVPIILIRSHWQRNAVRTPAYYLA